jgi:hypothetical protein
MSLLNPVFDANGEQIDTNALTTHVGDVTAQGVETEFTILPAERLTITGYASWLDPAA